MNYFEFVLMPVIGALIGWWTNLFAIKLIFWPINPIKLPLLNIEFQGLIPKRRLDISKNIGDVLEKEILSSDDIVERLVSEDSKQQLLKCVKDLIESKIYEKLPAFIPGVLKNSITEYFADVFDKQGGELFDEVKKQLINKAREEIQLKQMVEDKINSLDLAQLEDIIIMLSKRELRQIEVLGGVIGFFIGLIQAAFTCYFMG